THCCAWKQTVSVGQLSPSLRVWAAVVRSLSALTNHSLQTVISSSRSGIQDLPLPRCRPLDRARDFLAPLELLWSRDHDVLRDTNAAQGEPDFHLFLPLGAEE